jgi:hypothetical protein
MGRGRAKAKQTKVARQLKYSSSGTDLDALKAELSRTPGSAPVVAEVVEDVDEVDDDLYAKYIVDDDDEDNA